MSQALPVCDSHTHTYTLLEASAVRLGHCGLPQAFTGKLPLWQMGSVQGMPLPSASCSTHPNTGMKTAL